MAVTSRLRSFVSTGSFRPYADGEHLAKRRQQKSEILRGILEKIELPEGRSSRFVDFGSADGGIPVSLLESDIGERIREYVGITLLEFNLVGCSNFRTHPRYRTVVGDLQEPVSKVLPKEDQGRFDVVTATGFWHYLDDVKAALDNARWLLKDSGTLIVGIPSRWVLRFRLNPILMLGQPISSTRQVRSKAWWKAQFADNGWRIERSFASQLTGLPFPFTLLDGAVSLASAGTFGANEFFILRPGR